MGPRRLANIGRLRSRRGLGESASAETHKLEDDCSIAYDVETQ